MTMVILNPTDEDIEVTWGGINYTFVPDCRDKVEDSMGRQVLHNYANRGLVSLEYGDEGEIEMRKAKEGRERWNQFWTKQVVQYNQLNESNQHRQLPFVQPTDQVVYHAKRLGIKLIEPYRVVDESSKQIAMLMEHNKNLEKEIAKKDNALEGLQAQVSELTQNFQQFMALAGSKAEETSAGGNGDEAQTDFSSVKPTINKMNKKRFVGWMSKHWDEIQAYPDDVKQQVADKHETLYGIPLPTERPSIEQYDVA